MDFNKLLQTIHESTSYKEVSALRKSLQNALDTTTRKMRELGTDMLLITHPGPNIMNTIRVVRWSFGLGLKEGLALAKGGFSPTPQDLHQGTWEELLEELEKVGATFTLGGDNTLGGK